MRVLTLFLDQWDNKRTSARKSKDWWKIDIGFLEEDYSSEWASPSFVIPKKNGSSTIRAVTDFRKPNLLLKHHPFPIPKIGDMIRSMEGLTFASALDLNMGYYHIKLDADTQNLCTIVFPWNMGKYKYKRLPMSIEIAPDVFQNLTSKLVQDMEYVETCLDDLLMLTNRKNSFKDHQIELQMVLARLSTAGMRVNISKSKFFAEQIEYLGYWITRQVIQPIRNKVEMNAILNIKESKARKEETTTPVYWYSQLLSQHVVGRSELLARSH
jgi:hypothetical protein